MADETRSAIRKKMQAVMSAQVNVSFTQYVRMYCIQTHDTTSAINNKVRIMYPLYVSTVLSMPDWNKTRR